MPAGRWAEDRAADFLTAKGLRILARNFRMKSGEIDLVASDGDTLVLVEVKHRRDEAFSTLEECLTADKRRKLLKTGRLAWQRFGPDKSVRFDYVALVGPPESPEIRHYVNVIEGPGL